ncbi:MAG TPA: DUF3556 domain-containing protein [Polyangiaceae bacterium]|jgi:hypothetical protein
MGLLDPTPPPYDALDWVKRPLAERGRMVCEAWAMQGYGTPPGVFFAYLLKVGLYVAGWVLFCGFSPPLGGFSTLPQWWLHPIAFQKAIVWSMLFEVLGLGCGSGPLTGRYFPPVGGFLYFLRPGTTKLPFFPGLPVLGGRTRSALDVLLYLALLVASVRALVAPVPAFEHFLPLVVLVPLLGVADKTIFLAARGEHYWVTVVCFAFAGDWIAGAKAVQLALWFWAGFSKLNAHFPTVICVMTSNGPFTRFPWLRRRMYRDYPKDLRPSGLAVVLGHAGTALEMGVPIAFLLTPLGAPPVVAIALMLALHAYITSNVPMGVPLEWNVAVAYGGFALFWAHPGVSLLSLGPPLVAVFVVVMTVVVPLAGNLFPRAISFLLAMRYYAGNWAYSVWLFKGDSHRKLDALTKSSPWIYTQLDRFYERKVAVGLVGKVMGFRLMHLHGRALPRLLPRAVDRLEDYEWVDGELVAGMVLGWNFGEGHLHQEQLLASVQAQCGFAPGELRCIFVEGQPLGRSTLDYRVVDAATGLIEKGELSAKELGTRQPWSEAA